MRKLKISTQKNNQIIDITDEVNSELPAGDGICHLFILHTTASLTTADLDPGTDLDMLDAFNEMIPKLQYRHPHDPNHVGDHIMSSLISPSIILPFKNGQLILGTWQRVIIVELDGPRERDIIMSIIKED